ncbi:MAG: serine hydrolase [Candidatus Marinimicrobia bacterium]|nr:serine hydrolase [Candidatus Neomarinimicrobiota bacterium]
MINGFKRTGLLLLMLLNPLISQPINIPGLDEYIQRNMEYFNVPGLSIAIVKDEQVIFSKGYGTREIGQTKNVDDNTLFAIGSISKSTTAIALAMLEDEGKLAWNDKVIQHLPDFQMYDPWVTKEITITDLLTHRSGLPSVSGGTIWYGSDFSREEIVHRIRYLKPVSSFRSEYAYQNIMYVVAGQIIPSITGKTWDEFIRERLLTPLNMNRTTTTMAELSSMQNVASPHILKNQEVIIVPHRDYDNIGPAASIYSSAKDMAQYVKCLLNYGEFKGRRIFSETNAKEMFRPQMTIPVSDYSDDMQRRQPQYRAYGFGWFLEDYQGQKIIRHSGGVDGMRALVAMVPSENLGFVILTNQEEYRMYYTIFYRLLDHFLGFPEYPWDQVFQKSADSPAEEKQPKIYNTQMSLSLKEYCGIYQDRMVGDITVDIINDKLVLAFTHTPCFTAELEHWDGNIFRLTWRDPTIPQGFVEFQMDKDGIITRLKFDQPQLLDVDFDELEIYRKEE